MSSIKSALESFPIFDNVTINGDKTSLETHVKPLDTVFFQVEWSASTAVGVIKVQIPYDKVNDLWVDLDFASPLAVSGASGSFSIKLREVPFSRVRLQYVSTSGSGTLSAFILGKGV